MSSESLLIVGAGPTGLAAALLLAELGVSCRIVDRAPEPSRTSKAQIVNPRSLEILAASGVTASVLAESRPAAGVRFYRDWQPLAELAIARIRPAVPMSILPQARTEALLEEALRQHGIQVERPVELVGLVPHGGCVDTTLMHHDGRRERARFDCLVGADGAHSTVRHGLGIAFKGSAFPESWPLYDLHLEVPLDPTWAHVSFVPGGLVFLLCIAAGVWRVFGNLPAPLQLLPHGSVVGASEWESSFHISHRRAERLAAGRVVLAGDAAHIHSPIGARGMNLGIEDAFVFARCFADRSRSVEARLADYEARRLPVHASVVRRLELLTTLARGRPRPLGWLRRFAIPLIAGQDRLADTVARTVTGLDHAVEGLGQRSEGGDPESAGRVA